MVCIRARKGLFAKETDDGIVILNCNENKIFILNKTASLLWKLSCSDSKVSIDDILADIGKEYIINKENFNDYVAEYKSIAKRNPELFEVFEN